MFDILDYDDEMQYHLNEEQRWDKIKEEFKLDYNFDNTYNNMQEEDTMSAENARDNEVTLSYCFYFNRIVFLFVDIWRTSFITTIKSTIDKKCF